MLTDDQLRFVVLVLETPAGGACWSGGDAEQEAVDDIGRRSRELRAADPEISFGWSQVAAKVAWLRGFLAAAEREGGGGC